MIHLITFLIIKLVILIFLINFPITFIIILLILADINIQTSQVFRNNHFIMAQFTLFNQIISNCQYSYRITILLTYLLLNQQTIMLIILLPYC